MVISVFSGMAIYSMSDASKSMLENTTKVNEIVGTSMCVISIHNSWQKPNAYTKKKNLWLMILVLCWFVFFPISPVKMNKKKIPNRLHLPDFLK